MSSPIDPTVTLRPEEASAIIHGRLGHCRWCGEAGSWQTVRFKRRNKVIHLLLTRDDHDGDIIWWDGEFVALKSGDKVKDGIATWLAHGRECSVKVADAEGQNADERLHDQIVSPNFFPGS